MAKAPALPTILITNDDGITAPGIRNLVEAVKGLGKIIVVAPDKPQSAMGHAITIGHPLRMNKIDMFEGVESWQTSGTPVDLSLIHISEPTRRTPISYAVFCLKKKKINYKKKN